MSYIEIMKDKLDKKDRRLLLELDTDATQSLKELARKLRTTKEVVAYRIKQLEKNGIIRNYTAIYNPFKMGLLYCKLYLKYSHITEAKKKRIIDFIKKEKGFNWLATSEGSFDLMIGIHCRSIMEFDMYKEKIFSRFDSFFQKGSFAILTDGEAYPRQYFTAVKNPMTKVFVFGGDVKKEKLDLEDMKILTALSDNSRASSIEIAHATGLTDRIVRYRRKILEKKGVISGYKLFIDYRKLNHMFFKCLIKLQSADAKRSKDLLLYARQHPNVVYWQKVLGEWNIELDVEVASIEEFYKMANEIRDKFSDIVQNFDTLLVTEDIAIP